MYWLDILIVLAVGAFVASRFFSFRLPRDDNPDKNRHGWQELLDKLQQPNPNQPAEDDIPPEETPAKIAAPKKSRKTGGLAAIHDADPSFDEARFIEGVKTAYRYFYERYNALDEEGLENLCAPHLMGELETELEDFRSRKAIPDIDVQDIKEIKITDARLSGRSAIITVSITATQSEGEKKRPAPSRTVRQSWVLARALGSPDPNWELQSIQRTRADA